MSALRVARAATGRPRILKFDGCYHGHADSMLVRAGSGLAGQAIASSEGVSAAVAAETVVAPLDDEEELDRVFDANGAEIAAAIVEPLPANYGLLPQREAWLSHLADRCARAGVLLIFDEVISGFRVGKTGMAGRLGIRPDLVTYGKVIGGGFPVGAYAGRQSLMDRVAPAGGVYQAGTLSANPVGMRAGLASLAKAEAVDAWKVIDGRTERFCNQLIEGFADLSNPLDVVRQGSIFWICRRGAAPDPPARSYCRRYGRVVRAILPRCHGAWRVSAAFGVRSWIRVAGARQHDAQHGCGGAGRRGEGG